MKTHEFTIIASGLDPEADDYENRFFEAGCDDATLSFQKGVIIAEFHREAVTFSAAIASAYEAMLGAGAKVERIEPDHLVSLSEIAERSGLTRQAISLYTRAERREFPRSGRQGHLEASAVGLARSGGVAVRARHPIARGCGRGADRQGGQLPP